jgi:hypothetical protein
VANLTVANRIHIGVEIQAKRSCEMLTARTSHGPCLRGSHPLKIAKGGAASVVVTLTTKGWASQPSFSRFTKNAI